ncbi:MAG: hypothetical protein HY432_02985 [Candidatus Liptonbacteria bacterium]|nr:hypothetical protein [Candidatus Liptonbacteria bacterium]
MQQECVNEKSFFALLAEALGGETEDARARAALSVTRMMNLWRAGTLNMEIFERRYPMFGGIDEVRDLVTGLRGGDRNAWAKFLFAIPENRFEEFKPLSPFAEGIVVKIAYGEYPYGWARFDGDDMTLVAEDSDRAANLVRRAIEALGCKTHDGDSYVLVFGRFEGANAEVFQMGRTTSVTVRMQTAVNSEEEQHETRAAT